MLKRVFLILTLLFFAGLTQAAKLAQYLIDTPTAKVASVKTFSTTNRIFSNGGLLSYFTFTPLERFSIGTGLTFEHLVGTSEEDIKVLIPSLQLKFQFFDGTETWPMLALGFDNQGFYYDHDKEEYLQKAKGLYLATTQEMFFTGLILDYGLNITTDGFEFDKLYGYTAINYSLLDWLQLITEWDNIRSIKDSRVNSGLRIYVADFFALDFALRNFNHKAERILQLKYHYTF